MICWHFVVGIASSTICCNSHSEKSEAWSQKNNVKITSGVAKFKKMKTCPPPPGRTLKIVLQPWLQSSTQSTVPLSMPWLLFSMICVVIVYAMVTVSTCLLCWLIVACCLFLFQTGTLTDSAARVHYNRHFIKNDAIVMLLVIDIIIDNFDLSNKIWYLFNISLSWLRSCKLYALTKGFGLVLHLIRLFEIYHRKVIVMSNRLASRMWSCSSCSTYREASHSIGLLICFAIHIIGL